nr:uncharacterized protein CTRU02_12280 [Colletotrichum truncatum]KAF6784819.1 hypothetical protein CTRU02_12280 [Colletotrichum truncatum]
MKGDVKGRSTPEAKRQLRLEAAKFKRMNEYKNMFHKLQNLEDFPEILPAAKELLLSFLESGLSMARYRNDKRNILSVQEFDPDALEEFLRAERQDILDDFESYCDRRTQGSGPELFTTHREAVDWLKCRAPLNLIDGAWLCRVHRITTPFALRTVTRDTWQTLSEELGDAEMEKNHIFLYRKLLQDVGINLPDADTVDFLNPRHDMEQEQSWRTAAGQLLISLFPNEFLPEMLGFNLHFESLSGSDLKATRELPEFGISAYYYTLHISIDNADSGHSAMALATIVNFMDIVKRTGILDYQKAWKRIQAGYLLSQSLNDELTVHDYEERVAEMLYRKAALAQKMHCGSKARIGKRSITEWFLLAVNNESSCNDIWGQAFLDDLARSKPWIYRGRSDKSRLLRELSWNGKMFGAFTSAETDLFRAWIDSLPTEDNNADAHAYWTRVGGFETVENSFSPPRHDVAVTHPTFPPQRQRTSKGSPVFTPWPPLQVKNCSLNTLLALWFVHPCLLENTVAYTYQTATRFNSLILQLLRAEMGYEMNTSGIAGIDEQVSPQHMLDLVMLGLSMARRHKIPEPTCLGDVLNDETKTIAPDMAHATEFAYELLSWSMRPKENQAFLLGVARAFVDMEVWVARSDELLNRSERKTLQRITDDKLVVFEACLEDMKGDEVRLREFTGGYEYARAEIDEVLSHCKLEIGAYVGRENTCR